MGSGPRGRGARSGGGAGRTKFPRGRSGGARRGGRGERKSGPGVPRDGAPSGSAPSCAPGSPAHRSATRPEGRCSPRAAASPPRLPPASSSSSLFLFLLLLLPPPPPASPPFFPRIQTSGARKNPAGPALRRQNVPTSCGPTRSARRRIPPPPASPAESFSSPPPFPGLRLPSAPLAASFQYGTARQSACARRCLSPPRPSALLSPPLAAFRALRVPPEPAAFLPSRPSCPPFTCSGR